MPHVQWPLLRGRPQVQIVLTLMTGAPLSPRTLLADTGAGSRFSGIELILEEDDCLLCGAVAGSSVTLGGAYVGSFPLYDVLVQIPALRFTSNLLVVGVPSAPAGEGGIACFSFPIASITATSATLDNLGLSRDPSVRRLFSPCLQGSGGQKRSSNPRSHRRGQFRSGVASWPRRHGSKSAWFKTG